MILKDEIMEMMSEAKVLDLECYPFDHIMGEYSSIVVGSVDNMIHGNAIIEQIYDHYRKRGHRAKKQATKDSKWLVVVIDDVIVHVFLQSEREYYRVDEVWSHNIL